MKKYIYAFLMMAGLLTSCTNDDIQVDVVEVNKTTFTMNVETQPAYDTFKSTQDVRDYFLSDQRGDYYIGVYTYFYDEYGNLADSQVTYSKTFGTQKQNFTLNDGKYTAVTIQMIVDKDNKYESDTYEISGTDKLSTIEVSYKPLLDNGNQVVDSNGNIEYKSTAYWYESVGVITNDLNINGSVQEINITPKAIGVVIKSYCYNYTKSEYDWFLLLTKNSPKGRYLDPNKTGDSRFEYTYYNKENFVALRGYLKIQSDEERMDVYMLEEGDMQCCYAPQVGDDSFYIYGERNGMKDGHTYYGGLYYKGGSQPDSEGAIFDSFEEYQAWYNKMKTLYGVEPLPSAPFNCFIPYKTWGGKVSSVTSVMNGYNQTEGTSTTAVYNASSDDYTILYRNVENAEAVLYSFKSATTGLYDVAVFYDDEKYSLDQIKGVFENDFMYLGDSDNGMSMYISLDMVDVLLIYNNEAGYNVTEFEDFASLGIPQMAKGAKPQDIMRSLESVKMKQLEEKKQGCMMMKAPVEAFSNFSKSLFVK